VAKRDTDADAARAFESVTLGGVGTHAQSSRGALGKLDSSLNLFDRNTWVKFTRLATLASNAHLTSTGALIEDVGVDLLLRAEPGASMKQISFLAQEQGLASSPSGASELAEQQRSVMSAMELDEAFAF